MKKSLIIITITMITGLSFQLKSYAQARTVTELNAGYFVAGPTSFDMELFSAEKECQNWTWAACIQTVLNFYGLKIKQEQIIQKVYKGLPCIAPNAIQIINAISGWNADPTGKFSTIFSQRLSWNPPVLVDNLSNKNPLIVSLRNPDGKITAYVMSAIYFTKDSSGKPIVDKVVLQDVWPDKTPQTVLLQSVFLSRNPEFYKVWVTPKVAPQK
jgi:hypothetical protein